MIAMGIDVGGTYTRVGAVDIDASCGPELVTRCCATISRDHGNILIDWIVGAVGEVAEEAAKHPTARRATGGQNARVAGVGLALPGILDPNRRRLVRSVNLPFLQDRAIGDELAERTGYPVQLVTDAEAATWAEYAAYTSSKLTNPERSRGLKPAARCFVHLRIGTGIGCGLVVNGDVQRLDVNRSGHLDVLIIDHGADAPPCPCGKRGCLETVASGRVLHQRTLKLLGHARTRSPTEPRASARARPQTPTEPRASARANALIQGTDPGRHGDTGFGNALATLQQRWKRGDKAARTIVDQAAKALALGLTNLIDHFRPQVISIGGGVMTTLPCLLDEARQRVNASDEPSDHQPSITILRATHSDKAGTIGAALLASLTGPATS